MTGDCGGLQAAIQVCVDTGRRQLLSADWAAHSLFGTRCFVHSNCPDRHCPLETPVYVSESYAITVMIFHFTRESERTKGEASACSCAVTAAVALGNCSLNSHPALAGGHYP